MQIHRTKLRHVALALAASVLLPASAALAQMELLVDLLVDGGNNYNWQRVALPGTVRTTSFQPAINGRAFA